MAESAVEWRKKRLNEGDEIITWWDEGDAVYVLWFDASQAARGEAPYWLDHMAPFITHAGHQINGGPAMETIDSFSRPSMPEDARKRLKAYLAGLGP
jgi:hypothetical protein